MVALIVAGWWLRRHPRPIARPLGACSALEEELERIENPMSPSLASSITKAASRQTYYTIRFLVEPARREDAYRAYGYFRWVDDVLDAEVPSGPTPGVVGRIERRVFVDRQKALLDR